jgi:hypothetical protein
MTPPAIAAVRSAASVQLAAVPSPTVCAGVLTSASDVAVQRAGGALPSNVVIAASGGPLSRGGVAVSSELPASPPDGGDAHPSAAITSTDETMEAVRRIRSAYHRAMSSRVVRSITIALVVGCGPPAPVTVVPFEPAPATEAPPPPTTVTAPSPSGVSSADATRACGVNDDCVLVTGPCGEIVATNREHATEVQARYRMLASVGECARGAVPSPVDPMCDAHVCGVREASDPDARTCHDDEECVALPMACTWAIASRTAAGYARVVGVSEGLQALAAPPCELPEPPVLACRYAYCSRARDLAPDDDAH